MAEGIFNDIVLRNDQSEQFIVDSAATSSWNTGSRPHRQTQEVLRRLNISTASMHARQIRVSDYHDFDYIIGMDQQNIQDLHKHAPKKTGHKIHLLMDAVADKQGMDVPDPWYTGDFKETLSLVDEACRFWYQRMVAELSKKESA